ncbi:MAG: hypothetical protein IIV45_02780, partial [Lachnospiraceae bacterium]|nr:hypothetical protein [Lachnospiraceae bacterium]
MITKMLGKDTFLYERLELAMTRIQAIEEEQFTVQDAEFPWENYFIQVSAWMKDVYRFIEENEDGKTKDWCMDDWKKLYASVFAPIKTDYEISYANPDVT